MSDGGIGNGLEYWATIRLSGNLESPKIKEVMGKIRDILNGAGVNGEVVHAARLTVDQNQDPVVSVSLRDAKQS
jgi:hypothetical protein